MRSKLLLVLLTVFEGCYGFTQQEQKSIVNWFNDFRSSLAIGDLELSNQVTLPAAADMTVMEWDLELAHLAGKLAKRCTYPTRSQVSTYFSGNSSANLSDLLKDWQTHLLTKSTLTASNVKRYRTQSTSYELAQTLFSGASRFGCGLWPACRIRINGKFTSVQFLVCTFDKRLQSGDAVYEVGTPCSQCPSTCHPKYNELCKQPPTTANTDNSQPHAITSRPKIPTTSKPQITTSISPLTTTRTRLTTSRSRNRNTVRVTIPSRLKFSGAVSNTPSNKRLTPEERQVILDLHNRERRLVAEGNQKNRRAHMPAAANMFLMEWDDSLEAESQKWANKCQWKHDSRRMRDKGENLATTSDRNVTDLVTLWIDEVHEFALTNGVHKFSRRDLQIGIGHYTQMIWASTTRIGCGLRTGCNFRFGRRSYPMAYLVCRYSPGGNIYDYPVYKSGESCTKCLDFGGSCSADGHLCSKWNSKPHPVVQALPGNPLARSTAARPAVLLIDAEDTVSFLPSQSNQLKHHLLALHNEERRIVALGLDDGRRFIGPTASNMQILIWDNDLAKGAQDHANKCRINYGGSSDEYAESLTGQSRKNASEILQDWIRQGREQRLGSLSSFKRTKDGRGYLYTQMIWASSTRLGCGFKKDCTLRSNGRQFKINILVCRYSMRGNRNGESVYRAGLPCSECEQYGGLCDVQRGMCQQKLTSQTITDREMVDYYEESIGVRIDDDCDYTDFEEDDTEIPMFENSSFVKAPHGKAYAVIRQAGFRQSELMELLCHMCKAEILSSVFFIVHGAACPSYYEEPQYETVCHMNMVAGLVGILTGAFGLAAVCRHQKGHSMSVMYLLFCIISSVAFLLVIVNSGLWLAKLSDEIGRKDWSKTVGGVMILVAVALGVCFIISSTFICFMWNANQKQIHVVGTVARSKFRRPRVRPPARYRKSSLNTSQRSDEVELSEMQYHHVCTSRCNHNYLQ